MAPPHHHLHLSTPSLSTHRHRRCSTAQMCFFNILHIIYAIPVPDVTDTTSLALDDAISDNKGLVVDLNIGENCVFENNDSCKYDSELAVEEERCTEHSVISHVGDQSSGIDKPRDEGYLGLLIEAAQLILGDESEPDEKPSQLTEPGSNKSKNGAKRKPQCWTAAAEAEWHAEFEDTSPIVKSKRGRSQVLPFKYRDSVVEPLVRWTSSCKTISDAPKRRAK